MGDPKSLLSLQLLFPTFQNLNFSLECFLKYKILPFLYHYSGLGFFP